MLDAFREKHSLDQPPIDEAGQLDGLPSFPFPLSCLLCLDSQVSTCVYFDSCADRRLDPGGAQWMVLGGRGGALQLAPTGQLHPFRMTGWSEDILMRQKSVEYCLVSVRLPATELYLLVSNTAKSMCVCQRLSHYTLASFIAGFIRGA